MEMLNPSEIANAVGIVRRNAAPVLDAVAKAAREVRIVAITKYVDAVWCCAAIDAGLTELGENRILEGAEKYEAVRATGREFTAHLVGPIQSNKARKVPDAYQFVQALDDEKAARMVDKRCGEIGISLDALIEVNIDAEPQKSGVLVADADEFAAKITEHMPRLRLRGIMVIPSSPYGFSGAQLEQATRDSFQRARKLYEGLRDKHHKMDTLSMGMSADYTWAIEEGATMIRVGRMLWEP